ncbi:hypothetical protein GCM10010965_08320 [Caldalkalibacillus thermarum]|uniref:GNAT family N-acetyltransferase n=1 Tax=Caldalkalibacillus thermarum TaxID=296745 RepID=UPI001666010A|nr:GNAT family N-acetyltransferase [Caldalkalibacillus thermarum]GGK17639.1 hypothetical protein GCM10010965_08320 [Caldalkalibacillus thermarum]
MKLHKLTSAQVEKYRRALITFLKRHGDRRITRTGINWLEQADATQLSSAGTLVLCALKEKKLIGLLIVSNYGIDESYIAVHQHYRDKDIAKQMVQYAIHSLGKLYGRVALDNIPSLKVCLANDMVAFHLFNGPTGKLTLWVGGGDWTKEDVLPYS